MTSQVLTKKFTEADLRGAIGALQRGELGRDLKEAGFTPEQIMAICTRVVEMQAAQQQGKYAVKYPLDAVGDLAHNAFELAWEIDARDGIDTLLEPKTLIIFRGVAGTGKTTQAEKYAWHLASDMFPGLYVNGIVQEHLLSDAHEWHRSRIAGWMELCRSPIAIHNTLTKIWYLNPYLDLALQYGYRVQIVDCTTEYGSIHNVPDEVMAMMRLRWEPFDVSFVEAKYRCLFQLNQVTA